MSDDLAFVVDRLAISMLLHHRTADRAVLTRPSFEAVRDELRKDFDYTDNVALIRELLEHDRKTRGGNAPQNNERRPGAEPLTG